MMTGWLVITAGVSSLLAAVSWGTHLRLKQPSKAKAALSSRLSSTSKQTLKDILPTDSVWIKVQCAETLIHALALTPLVNSMSQKSGLTKQNFEQDMLPVLHKVAEFVQLLPASESQHHAGPGGLLVHLFETANHALSIRQGRTLPKNAPVEDIAKAQHRWTYAVFLAALLHDIGKPMADLAVQAQTKNGIGLWQPLAGNLLDLQADQYEVNFRADRDYRLHERLPAFLLTHIVPQTSLHWLSVDTDCFGALHAFLSRDRKQEQDTEMTNPQGVIAEITLLADQESVRNNLKLGSRTRFGSAKAVPLIEKLVQGIKELVAHGGVLPLNRAGAAGWVFDGDVWFAGKRLVEILREHLNSKGIKGIPGTDKNDRIFDELLDYGVIVRNPITNRSIWHVRVEQTDGWTQNLTVLRFPLARLYAAHMLPSLMAGRIVIDGAVAESGSASETPEAISPLVVANSFESEAIVLPAVAMPVSPPEEIQDAAATIMRTLTPIELPLTTPTVEPSSSGFLEIRLPSGKSKKSVPVDKPIRQDSVSNLPAVEHQTFTQTTTPVQALEPAQPLTILAQQDDRPNYELTHSPPPHDLDLSQSLATPPVPEYLDEGEQTVAELSVQLQAKQLNPIEQESSAVMANIKLSQEVAAGKNAGAMRTILVGGQEMSIFKPVTPNSERQMAQLQTPKEIPEVAYKFMHWVQAGIANGDITINNVKAAVHFVQIMHAAINKGAGDVLMLLVTPLCFRNFAEIYPEYGDSKTIQSAFLKAKWHVPAEPGNINILRFKTGGMQLLSCIALKDPERFVNPVPNSNDLLRYDDATTRQFMSNPKPPIERPYELPERSFSSSPR